MKRTSISALLAILSIAASAQFVGNTGGTDKTRTYIDDAAWVPREHNVDFLHMRLELSFEPQKALVTGKVTHRFTPLRQEVDSVWLDGPGITIKTCTVNGKASKFRTEKNGLWIFPSAGLVWGERDSMTLEYTANPRRGLYFIGWDDPNNLSRKQIWSQGQGIDNRNWIPMYDEMNDKMTTELIVTFDDDYKVLSNGVKLKEKANREGTKTWHYRMNKPHAPYLIMLGIGIYDVKETKSASGVPVNLWYYPEWKDRVETTYKSSEKMIDFFEKEIGVKYPWESYSMIPVQDFMYGAMENTTATVFGDFLFVDQGSNWDRSFLGVNAHELAHQWFGDYVTARCDAHHWLQESFATYYNQMYEREEYGMDYFDWARREAQNNAVNETLKNLLPVAHSESGSVRHYPKGAFVLNMLKYVLGGREVYNKVIKHYLEKHPYQAVDSEDLLESVHEVTGMSLDWFWEQWVYRGGEPAYNVSVTDMTDNRGVQMTRFNVEQTHKTNDVVGLFRMPIWFEVHYADGTADRKMAWIANKNEEVNIINASGKKIDYVLFDPNNEILKTVTFEKPWAWNKMQAMKAKNMLDRYDAIVAMRNMSPAQKRDVLLQAYDHEKFQAVKGEIIRQLIGDTDPASRSMIRSAISGTDANVHKHVLVNTPAIIPADLAKDYEKLLGSPSYEAVTMALEKLCFSFPASAPQYLDQVKNTVGATGRLVEIRRLEIAASLQGDKNAPAKLVEYSSNSYEFRTRVNAMQALKRLDYFDNSLLKNLLNACVSSNGRLAGPANDLLRYFYEQTRYRKTIRDHVDKNEWPEWQKEIINKTLN
ncbi:MAG: aminopeptidase N [Bacteroidetes bacterium]|nr:MAG: aminopeptidase N [Bacteroidota bacterium]